MSKAQYYLGKEPLFTRADVDHEVELATRQLRIENERLLADMDRIESGLDDNEEDIDAEIARLEQELSSLHSIVAAFTELDTLYHFRKYAKAYKRILTHYAKFKVGDRVQLASTPDITSESAPGWLGCEHFLVKGARGTVVSSSFTENGSIWYGIEFDEESWIGDRGVRRVVRDRHSYAFREQMLEAIVDEG